MPPSENWPEVWPLTQSQTLSVRAVERDMAALQQELRNRVAIAFMELCEAKSLDPATLTAEIVSGDGRLSLKVTPRGPAAQES